VSFTTLLREIVDGCAGGIGVALMGNDGVAIEQVTASGAGDSPLADDIATAGTEFGRILEEIRKAADAVAGGAVQEATIVLSRVVLVFRSVDEETFLALALHPDGNLGKARYLIRRQLPALRQAL
jgi:predicted regulator of Ras-like GTPase activity (Roadblock/LC7/MglB family)